VAARVRALLVAALVVGAAAAPASAKAQATAAFAARSYRPGQDARLVVTVDRPAQLTVQLYAAGAWGAGRWLLGPESRPVVGAPVGRPLTVRATAAERLTLRLPLAHRPSGVYLALVRGDGREVYAPFVLRPWLLGEARVLVVEPTNTWQAYNFTDGDSWYLDPAVHVVDLARPYEGDGLPPHFQDYDLGFLRWYWRSGERADFVSDDDLERFESGAQLRRLYRLIVFPGHEEYVTGHAYDIVEQFRDLGGNLAFLSADNFFYAVTRVGHDLVGRTRWRDLGRPESALVGAQYEGWEERIFPNRPYRVVAAGRLPWLFAGTGLRDGDLFGKYGIEIDGVTAASPPGTIVVAEIPHDFGPGMPAEMTYYRLGAAQVFDAGVMNFGGTADWPVVSTIVDNLWQRLSE